MIIITMGLPGAGKGTIAKKLNAFFKFEIVATGEILRQAIQDHTDLGEQVKESVHHGELIDDQIVIDLITDLLKPNKDIILEGFPRNLKQAEALTEILESKGQKIESVLHFKVDDDVMHARLNGRRICPSCHAVYHTEHFPSKDGKHCDHCSAELVQRDDDLPENLKIKLEQYNTYTSPVIAYYEDLGLITEIDANQSSMDMYYSVLESNSKFTERSFH